MGRNRPRDTGQVDRKPNCHAPRQPKGKLTMTYISLWPFLCNFCTIMICMIIVCTIIICTGIFSSIIICTVTIIVSYTRHIKFVLQSIIWPTDGCVGHT